ncbi:hypothetical protein Dform_01858 [Dehalogenimonas formicexedens]|uniref:Uncharacterized protein n=1 Tax=Dehalogenimonas formicexedens TaxID=1839801 RepID=A0A1P8F9N1_9CHLR|nr:hypothetical protein Dform_01858 [Dehalogenimonas formicexedens]
MVYKYGAMISNQTGQEIQKVALLPVASIPPERRLPLINQNNCPAPPIVGGFQMPLPGLSGGRPEVEGEPALDWHCYLGSR